MLRQYVSNLFHLNVNYNLERVPPLAIQPEAVLERFPKKNLQQNKSWQNKPPTYLSPSLFGFRKGYSTRHSVMINKWKKAMDQRDTVLDTVMINKWKKAMDHDKLAGELLTDLSKAFDCLSRTLNCKAWGMDSYAWGLRIWLLLLKLRYIYIYIVISQAGSKELKVDNSVLLHYSDTEGG